MCRKPSTQSSRKHRLNCNCNPLLLWCVQTSLSSSLVLHRKGCGTCNVTLPSHLTTYLVRQRLAERPQLPSATGDAGGSPAATSPSLPTCCWRWCAAASRSTSARVCCTRSSRSVKSCTSRCTCATADMLACAATACRHDSASPACSRAARCSTCGSMPFNLSCAWWQGVKSHVRDAASRTPSGSPRPPRPDSTHTCCSTMRRQCHRVKRW